MPKDTADAVTIEEAVSSFLEKYPNWKENPKFAKVFSELREITQIDSCHQADPRSIFECFVNYSDKLQKIEEYTALLSHQDWFVVFAYFAGCDITPFQSRFDELKAKSAGDSQQFFRLKRELGSFRHKTKPTSLKSLKLKPEEKNLLEFLINKALQSNRSVRITTGDKIRVYKIAGKANALTRKAIKTLTPPPGRVYSARENLLDRDLIWLDGGISSRKKGKKIGVWKVLI